MTEAFAQKTRKATISLKVSGQFDTLDIGNGLYAFKRSTRLLKTERKSEDGYNMASPYSKGVSDRQGFFDEKNLEKALAGKSYSTTDLVLCEDKLIEHLRMWGWQDAPGKKDRERFEWQRSDVYDALLEDPSRVEKLMRLDHGSHMRFDWTGKVLPVPIWFSYMDGRIAEDKYDLKRTAEILLARDDVHVFPRQEGWRDDPDREGKATTVEQSIISIPGYNSERGRSRTIYFIYRPSVEDYRLMWEKCLSYKANYPSTERHRAIFDLDLLGLKAGGACLVQNYWDSNRPDTSNDDNYGDDDDN